ncbi:MAG TPA: hypothetical protein VFV37_10155 [Luteibaculaceae bacterium]|nr:hypothetical protein [Luteibaculaceae bacterium]
MKKDIAFPEVIGVSVGITQEIDDSGESIWRVYLINQKKIKLTRVLVSSTGYGEQEGEKIRTSTLRHFFEEVEPQTAVLVEPIMPNLFGLTNEYWVSFYIDDHIYDKRFIFLPESILPSNKVKIPIVDKPGVLIG